jgi:hypothetical protein
MANKKNIALELRTVIGDNQDKFKTESFKKLSQANDKYNSLVKSGTIKKRGYTLRGIEDSHLYRTTLNH